MESLGNVGIVTYHNMMVSALYLLKFKNLPASTGNLPLEILAVEHTPYTKYLGPK